MKPYVICHMNASVDGRILGSQWRPAENRMAGLFERLHEQLGGGSWLIDRVTGSEYAKADSYPDDTAQTYPREPWFSRHDVAAYGIALDAHGKVAWARSDIGSDPIVAVLTERVSDPHLAAAAAFEHQAFESQLAVQKLQRQPQIELLLTGEDVRDAVLAQPRDHRLHRTKLKKALHDRQYLRTCLAQDGDSAFVLTSQVRQQPVCMINVLESRQQKLLKRFSDVWELACRAKPRR